MGVVNKRKHTSQFKFDVAIKAVESKHVAEVARLYGLNQELRTLKIAG